MKRFFVDYGTEGDTVLFTEFLFRLFCLTLQVGQGFQGKFIFLKEEVVDKHAVQDFGEILSAQEVVTGYGADFHNGSVQFQDGNVQGAAAQVEDQVAGFFFLARGCRFCSFLIDAIGNGCGCWFIDNTFYTEPGQFAGFFCGFSLAVIEIGRHTDDRFFHFTSQIAFRIFLQGTEQKCR